jgi:hypothetical protein
MSGVMNWQLNQKYVAMKATESQDHVNDSTRSTALAQHPHAQLAEPSQGFQDFARAGN